MNFLCTGDADALYAAANSADTQLLSDIATASELMRSFEHGWSGLRFFPAEASGGIAAFEGFAGPFAPVKLCSTGCIDAAKDPTYFALPNLLTAGGSWMVLGDSLRAKDWHTIDVLAKAVAALRG